MPTLFGGGEDGEGDDDGHVSGFILNGVLLYGLLFDGPSGRRPVDIDSEKHSVKL